MPLGTGKNMLYQCALPFLGLPVNWQATTPVQKAMKKRKVVGASIQRFEKGQLTESHHMGLRIRSDSTSTVNKNTMFRTASITKMVMALLVLRLQSLNLIHVTETLTELLGYTVCNPHCQTAPITLAMLLSHTSSIIDSENYQSKLNSPTSLRKLLLNDHSFSNYIPGTTFIYSNLAAGIVGSVLEERMNMNLESIAQEYLFKPLKIHATFDVTTLKQEEIADCYRVLPKEHTLDMALRIENTNALTNVLPDKHYTFASGNLFTTASDLAKLMLVAHNGANGFLGDKELRLIKQPIADWPDRTIHLQHGMGMFQLNSPTISNRRLWGHQGFAYGAVNGAFMDEHGSGFVLLNNGASEQRIGHLAIINRDLIKMFMR